MWYSKSSINFSGFDWDNGNIDKSLIKHSVTPEETEQLFSNTYVMYFDYKHSQIENRYFALGKTNNGKLLNVGFTLRNKDNNVLIRPISSRSMNKKERLNYEKEIRKK